MHDIDRSVDVLTRNFIFIFFTRSTVTNVSALSFFFLFFFYDFQIVKNGFLRKPSLEIRIEYRTNRIDLIERIVEFQFARRPRQSLFSTIVQQSFRRNLSEISTGSANTRGKSFARLRHELERGEERVILESTRATILPSLPSPSADEISCLNRGYCELDYFDIDIALQSWLGACNRTRYTESRKLDELERRTRRRSPELLTGCNVSTLPSSSIRPAPSRNIVAPASYSTISPDN